jgi:hypothetical protein
MSEFELNLLRQPLLKAIRQKASRGELQLLADLATFRRKHDGVTELSKPLIRPVRLEQIFVGNRVSEREERDRDFPV